MNFSKFGRRFTKPTGILKLMNDLDAGINQAGKSFFLGGGNPAHIDEVQKFLQDEMLAITSDKTEFGKLIGNYDGPVGNADFIRTVAAFLKDQIGWQVSDENIALTNGSQNSFFYLFNLFAGEFEDGSHKQILLPVTPEYIGYADIGLSEDFFLAAPPHIEIQDELFFKYRLNTELLEEWEKEGKLKSIGAIAVTRPTNPTGNVLTENEVDYLYDLSQRLDVPLIIDAAYGYPFPDVHYVDTKLNYRPGMICTLSLSKFGMPGARTGIVIAPVQVTDGLSKINAILNLAGGSLGPVLAQGIFEKNQVQNLNHTIREHYRSKKDHIVSCFQELLSKHPVLKGKLRLHIPEGAFFLWVWIDGLPVADSVLYESLKAVQVYVVPGNYYFPGLTENIPGYTNHRSECFRLSYGQSKEDVAGGVAIFGEQLAGLFA